MYVVKVIMVSIFYNFIKNKNLQLQLKKIYKYRIILSISMEKKMNLQQGKVQLEEKNNKRQQNFKRFFVKQPANRCHHRAFPNQQKSFQNIPQIYQPALGLPRRKFINIHQKPRMTTINSDRAYELQKLKKKKQRDFRQLQKRNKQQSFNICGVTVVGEKSLFVKFHVKKINELVGYLMEKTKNINRVLVGFKTVPQNLEMDYCLTQGSFDGSFLNGNEIYLQPIYRISQKTVNFDSFEVFKCIGTGGFSRVYLCKFKEDGNFYAMKIIEKDSLVKKKKKQIITNERNIMKKLDNPFIISLKFAFEMAHHAVFVLQYCPGSQLFGLIKSFKQLHEDTVRFYTAEILLGLQHIHSEGIIFRDLKPENILLDANGHIRITDFGLSKPNFTVKNRKTYSFCGSPEYMAPEMIMKNGHSFSADFYSLGSLIYEMLVGIPPFYSESVEKIYQNTINKDFSIPSHVKISTEATDILEKLLEKNQKYRIGALSGVKEIFAHPWFYKINKQKLLSKGVEAPITFCNAESIKMDFHQFHEQNYSIKKLEQQYREDFEKKLNNFYYDYRLIKGNRKASSCQNSYEKGIVSTKKKQSPLSIPQGHPLQHKDINKSPGQLKWKKIIQK